MTTARIPMHRRRLVAGLAGLAVLMMGGGGGGAPQQVFAQTDADGDNLIEVRNLEQLNAIRYDLDGDGVANTTTPNYTAVFPAPSGCPVTADCDGYELMANLNFDISGDRMITTADGVLSWGSGSGWQPIGTDGNSFTAEFHGNGHTISHLFINSTGTDTVGLFHSWTVPVSVDSLSFGKL